MKTYKVTVQQRCVLECWRDIEIEADSLEEAEDEAQNAIDDGWYPYAVDITPNEIDESASSSEDWDTPKIIEIEEGEETE